MRLRKVQLVFNTREHLVLDRDDEVRDSTGVSVPLALVLDRLADGDVLWHRGMGRTEHRRPDWDEEPPAEPDCSCETLLHLAGIAYASRIYDRA